MCSVEAAHAAVAEIPGATGKAGAAGILGATGIAAAAEVVAAGEAAAAGGIDGGHSPIDRLSLQ
jgi:hypothetical protein